MNTAVLKKNNTKQVILDININKYPFFIELVKSFDFVQIAQDDSGDSKEEILANLTQGFEELKLYKQGKLKTTPAKDFLDEL
jgi:hypothetical protein